MRPCNVISIVTPKNVVLNGLWWGAKRPKRVIVWVHGLGSSVFSKLDIVQRLVDQRTTVVTFNNRGHDLVSNAYQTNGRRKLGGAGYEVFTECVDDIQGAINFARRNGAKEIFLAGHSTGCQKSIYWAATCGERFIPSGVEGSRTKTGRGVRGIVLLAPISDYSIGRKGKHHAKALAGARTYMRMGIKHELLPVALTGQVIDAQRYVSLYSGDSAEEIFPYWDAARDPKALKSVRVPILVLLAEKDEYADRSAKKIRDWFATHLKESDKIVIVPRARHSFSKEERAVARAILGFAEQD